MRYRLLLTGMLLLGLSFGWVPLFFQEPGQKKEGERIFAVFEKKEQLILDRMQSYTTQLTNGADVAKLWVTPATGVEEKESIYFTISKKDTLVYWSSSLVAFDPEKSTIRKEGELRRLPTGWFYLFSKAFADYTVWGYMLIKRDFPYQNRYIRSSFQEDFHLSSQCEITPEERAGDIKVYCHEGKFHFGIRYTEKQPETPARNLPPLLFFILAVLLLSIEVGKNIRRLPLKPWLQLILTIAGFGLLYLMLISLRLPGVVFDRPIFGPGHFAHGRLLASLGDYFLLSWFMFCIGQFYFVAFSKTRSKPDQLKSVIYAAVFAAAYFLTAVSLFRVLLVNSDISTEFYSRFSLSLPNIIATGSMALQMTGLAAILIRIRCRFRDHSNNFRFTLWMLLPILVLTILGFLAERETSPVALSAYMLVVLLLDKAGVELISRFKLTSLLVYGLIMAFGLNLFAQKEIAKRIAATQQVLAVNLATERDPAAEIFLSDFESKIANDSLINTLLEAPYQGLRSYLKNNYFNGFWNNYELQVTPCSAVDSLIIAGEKKKFPCAGFFHQLKTTKGVELPGSDFYFMDKLNGRISYLGEMHLKDKKNNRAVLVFIELTSKIMPEGKGYPQLLLDQQALKRDRNEGYSYAKYFDTKLVDRGGNYAYAATLPFRAGINNEFNYFTEGGYTHCIYWRNKGNCLVVSYPVATWMEMGKGFPPLFMLIWLLGYLWIFANRKLELIARQRTELRGKIQFTMVTTLLAALLLVGLGVIRYNYLEFQRTMKENLDQRVRTISLEMALRIGETSKLDTIHEYLAVQLAEISDIAWTDINVYDLNGRLAASSRREIFDQGLTSGRMNSEAFRQLSVFGNPVFIHNERLGSMEFFSVYAPLINGANMVVGYVNLPWYNRQDEFTRQVTGFIVAFINLYILLVLIVMVIALLISTKLTEPLLQIEQKLKGIALGKENLRIEYAGEDEIGRLVMAYNKKVEELAESAALLAKTERESAWKEMARQIAHEINNPLTPMKLNIQYLQKIREEGTPGFDAYFHRVTRMLVAQIDALSEIASAFSDFARLPASRIEILEMKELVKEVATLFDLPEGYILELQYPEDACPVAGDKEQLRRALVNIIRNAAQAVQNRQDGHILIRLEIDGKMLGISITDNGSGIAETDREKLFVPNFTTKSGGTGLGLAITRSIVENYGGKMEVASKPGETTFTMLLPVLQV